MRCLTNNFIWGPINMNTTTNKENHGQDINHCIPNLNFLWIKQNTTEKIQTIVLRTCLFVCLMVFNATFNNISVISWRSVILVEETGGPGENHQPVASHWQTLSHNVVHVTLIEIRTNNINGDRHWLHM